MFLDVGEGHRIFYTEFGSPTGKPAIILHGGPGGWHEPAVAKLFNLRLWRVIMFDQRGCGQSTPFLSLRKNTTWDLVSDIEKLRCACSVDRWTVFGGSWGSTLALAYASKHIDHVAALLIRGVFLMEPWEIDWLNKEGGASRIFREEWQRFAIGSGDQMPRYARLLKGRKTRKVSAKVSAKVAAKAWCRWENSLTTLQIQKADAIRMSAKQEASCAVLGIHYLTHRGWIKPGVLLAAASKIPTSVPVIIVQGRYDMVCPAASALSVKEAIKHAELHMTIAGHSASEPANATALKAALVKLSKVSLR